MKQIKLPLHDTPDIVWKEIYANSMTLHDGFVEYDLRASIEVKTETGEWINEYVVDVWEAPISQVWGIKLEYSNSYGQYWWCLSLSFKETVALWFNTQKSAAHFYKATRTLLGWPIKN